MKFKLKRDSEIFILAPANIDTGGPMCLHELAYILKNKFKKKVYMHYFPLSVKNPIHKNYKYLKIPFKKKIEDLKKNILIIPEFYKSIEISKSYNYIQKGLWWLSVDFFLYHRFIYKNHSILRSLIKLPYKIVYLFNRLTNFYFGNISLFKYLKFIYYKNPLINVFKIKNIKVNFSHSEYQFITLKKSGIKSLYLSDRIRNEYFRDSKKVLIKNKKNIICYNPLKSSIFFEKFIKLNPDLKFIPLVNLNLKQLIAVLSKSKIYMDFGFHPGQDRLPREAAILKNCVITNREGSASIYKDLPIKNEFKFYEKKVNFLKMRNKVELICKSFPKELKKFNFYRKVLSNQEKRFMSQINNIFNKK